MSDDIAGSDWSKTEVDLIVADYFDMLQLELTGKPFNKAALNRELQERTGRVRGSIEFKHQNISAVLEELGLPWIKGYKPRHNYQNALIDGVGRYLASAGRWFFTFAGTAPETAEDTPFTIGPPPALSAETTVMPKPLRRLVRKYDPAERDARNRALGKRGEEFVFKHERVRLMSGGRDDLARKLEWTSEERGDGAGYDIHSFELDGADRLLEVKTTNGAARTPFYISENELAFSEERPEAFKLLRLHDFRDKPGAFQLVPPLDKWVKLRPSVYKASF